MTSHAPIIKTVREGLLSALTDFVSDAGFITELDLVMEFVYELAAYREEDIEFFPSVFLLKQTPETDPLSMIAPGADRVPLKTIESRDGAVAILKDCAALADGGWSVFVEIDGSRVRYGLFRSESLPISVSSAETLADPDTNTGVGILVRNCARNCIELVTGQGRRMELAFSSSRPTTESTAAAFLELSKQATKSASNLEETTAVTYLERLLTQICHHCHGTMIIVLPGIDVPEQFRDGVVLDPPMDLIAAFLELRQEKSASALSRLASREALLRGMIQSDGITILSDSGQLVAFRVFVKPNEDERKKLDTMKIRGGARSRAHELVKLRLGNPVSCVFFRSQDGHTVCTVK